MTHLAMSGQASAIHLALTLSLIQASGFPQGNFDL